MKMKTQPRLDAVAHALKEINRALKLVRIYPSDHPVTAESAKPAFQAILRAISGQDSIIININKDSFYMDGEVFGEQDCVLKELAFLFFARFISELKISEQIKPKELQVLLDFLNMSPSEVERLRPLEDWLGAQGVENITLIQDQFLLPEETEETDPDEISNHAGFDLVEVFESLHSGTLDSDQIKTLKVLFNQDPVELASLISSFIKWRQTVGGTLSTSAGLLYHGFKHIGSELEVSSVKAFKSLVKNLVQALVKTDAEIAAEMFVRQILRRAPSDVFAAEIFCQTGNTELFSILELIETDKQGRAQILASWPAILRIKKIRDKAQSILVDWRTTEFHPGLTGSIIDELQTLTNTNTDENEKSLRSEAKDTGASFNVKTILASFTPISESETEELKTEVRNSFDHYHVTGRFMSVLVSALMRESDPEIMPRMLKTVEQFLMSLMLTDRHVDLADYLESIRCRSGECEVEPAVAERLKAIVRRLSDIDNVERIITWWEANQQAHPTILTIIDNLGRGAVENLIEILKVERDMRRRRHICGMISSVGAAYIGTLRLATKDSRWYVVRNVAMILGKIGNDEALEVLLSLTKHPHDKVRVEVIGSLGNYRDNKAIKALIGFLKDPELALRIKAVRRLEMTASQQAAKAILDIITSDEQSYKDIDLKIAAIEAVGRMGFNQATPVLKSLARGFSFLSSAKKTKLRQTAREQLRVLSLSSMRKNVREDRYAKPE